MHKKYVFVDVDGTLVDHSTRSIPNSALEAIKLAKNNGHEVVICTGRPPCLLYDIHLKVGVSSYITANGKYVVDRGEVILSKKMPTEVLYKLATFADERKFDLAYEGVSHFRRSGGYRDFYLKFSDAFNIEIPEIDADFFKTNDIFQVLLYATPDEYHVFEDAFPELMFSVSNEFGVDVTSNGGWKDEGIKAFVEKYNLSKDDLIAIGDGFNDITMFEYCGTSVAMGNAKEQVKKFAQHVTDNVENDGLFKAFKLLNLI